MVTLRLARAHVQQMIEQATAGAPEEICGLIAGEQDGEAVTIIPLRNHASQPQQQFDADPIDLLRALRELEDAGQQIVAHYHSHPTSPPIPSQLDIAQARQHHPDLIQLIISLQHNEPEMAAWQITPVSVERIELEITHGLTDLTDAGSALSRAQTWAIILSMAAAVAAMLIISLVLLPAAPPLPPPGG